MNMHDEALTERIIERKSVFDGYILHIEHWTVALPNGKTAGREVAKHMGAAAVVPIDAEGCIYMVRQFRAPLERVMLEIPAGKLDSPGEDRLKAAKRELEEETGFTARVWTHLGDIATSPGFCTEVISLYMACGLDMGEARPDEDEFLNLVKLPFAEALSMVKRGEIQDGKSVSAILMASEALRDKPEGD